MATAAPALKMESYYEVPVDILEDYEQLRVWARQAVACQRLGVIAAHAAAPEVTPV